MVHLKRLNMHSLIAKELSRKIWSTVRRKNGCIASAASATESSPFDSRTERKRFASLERATGEKGRLFMKKKIKYTDEPLGALSVVRDSLPPPEELAFKEESVKITMALSKSSVAFFKKAAQKYHTPYQKMIRKLIDAYATRHPLP